MATPQEIRNWLNANPEASDAQIFQAMQQHGVTPEQLQAVTGGNLAGIQQRYNTQMQAAPMRAGAGIAAAPGTAPMNVPTGLAGSEQALGAGYESALASLLTGMGQARNDLTTQSTNAQNTISDAVRQALSGIESSGQNAGKQVTDAYGRAEGYMSPFMQQGQQVNPLLLALTGASGQDAFNKAFTDSPVQQFLLERGNRNILANSAATGGLGGANVQKELSKYGQGVAAQALQDQINNLMGLNSQGFNAATNSAQLAAGAGDRLAGITQNTGLNMANTGLTGASAISGLQGNLGQTLGNMNFNGGLNAANYALNTGQNIASGRTQAGRDLAGYIGNASGNLANIAQNQGQQVAGIYDTTSGNLANLLASSGQNQSALLQWLAGAQAQTAQNASGQYAGVPNTALAPANNLQSIAQLLGGAGTMIGAIKNDNLRAL